MFVERHCPSDEPASFYNDWVLWIFKHLPFQYMVSSILLHIDSVYYFSPLLGTRVHCQDNDFVIRQLLVGACLTLG